MEQKVRPPLHLPGLHHASEKQQKEKEHPQDAGREGKGQQTADPHRQKVEGKKQGKLTACPASVRKVAGDPVGDDLVDKLLDLLVEGVVPVELQRLYVLILPQEA